MATRPKHELEALARNFGWKVRPLTQQEVEGSMTSDELAWHEVFNRANLDAALATPPASTLPTANEVFVAQEKELLADKEYLDWAKDNGVLVSRVGHQHFKDMKAEIEAGKAAVETFLDQHDEYIHSDSSQKAIRDYLAQYKLSVTLENLEIAFEALTHAGVIAVDNSPRAVRWKNGQPQRMEGKPHHPALFADPSKAASGEKQVSKRVSQQSADEFLRNLIESPTFHKKMDDSAPR